MERITIVFTGKEQLELHCDHVPAIQPGKLLVQTTRTLVSNGTERIVFTRNFEPGTSWDSWVKYPFSPGYLQTGVVRAVGGGVEGWKVGDRVVTRANHSSHHLLSPEEVHAIPSPVNEEEAVWMGLGKITQIGVRAAEHKLGDAVAVVGLGLLGQLVVQYARLSGAREVIAIDTVPMRLQMAQAHGATRTVHAPASEALTVVREATVGRGADMVYEVTGHPAVFATALPLARKFGTLVLLGDAGTPSRQTLTGDVVNRGLRIVGAHDTHPPAAASPRDQWTAYAMEELFLNFLARRQMRTADLITHRFKPQDAPTAYRLLTREGQSIMGILFEWA